MLSRIFSRYFPLPLMLPFLAALASLRLSLNDFALLALTMLCKERLSFLKVSGPGVI
jgi:hypothetical protein